MKAPPPPQVGGLWRFGIGFQFACSTEQPAPHGHQLDLTDPVWGMSPEASGYLVPGWTPADFQKIRTNPELASRILNLIRQ